MRGPGSRALAFAAGDRIGRSSKAPLKLRHPNALLALGFVSIRGRAATFGKTHAVRLLKKNPTDEADGEVTTRYFALKALGMLAHEGHREALAAFAFSLRDRSDAIRFGAGEHFLAVLPSISLAGRCTVLRWRMGVEVDGFEAIGDGIDMVAACEAHARRHGTPPTDMRWSMTGAKPMEITLGAFDIGLGALLREAHSPDSYNRFAAQVVLRRIAGRCHVDDGMEPHVGGGNIEARVEKVLAGSLFIHGQDQLVKIAASVRHALAACEYVPRARPLRTRWWLQEPVACLRLLKTLSPARMAGMTTLTDLDYELEAVGRAEPSGVLLARQVVTEATLLHEQQRYLEARSSVPNERLGSGRIYCGGLNSREQFEGGLMTSLTQLIGNLSSSG